MTRLVFSLLALLAPLSGVARPPKTPPVSEAQVHVDQGNTYFDAKQWDQAIAEYTVALALDPHPDLVWNIARSHEESGRLAEARALFERYAVMTSVEADQEAARSKIEALVAREAKARKALLTVETEADVEVRIGGVVVGRGPTASASLLPGRYRVIVRAQDGRTGEQVVAMTGGQDTRISLKPDAKAKVAVRAEPAVPPPPTTWAGSYAVVGAEGEAGLLSGASLALDAAGAGTVTQHRKRPLEPWRLQHCQKGHGPDLESDVRYVARLTGDGLERTLELTSGETTCSCAPFCKIPTDLSFPVLAQPDFEGLIGTELILTRDQSAGRMRVRVTPADLTGTWQPLLWPAAPGPGARLELGADGNGALLVTASGEFLSWQRRACPSQASWTMDLRYPARVEIDGTHLRLVFALPATTACSCPGACGTPPRLAVVELGVPPVPNTMVGPGVFWHRIPVPTQLAEPK
mgnify:FL=1